MFDLLFLSVVVISTGFAVLRGGLQELSTIIALGLAAGLAWMIAPPMLTAIGLADDIIIALIIAALMVGAFFIAFHIGAHLILKRFPLSARGNLFNQIGGGAFGFVRGLILIGLAYLGYSYYLDESQQPETVQTAFTQPVASGLAHWLEGFAPGSTRLDSATAEQDQGDAAADGYDRADRSGLNEIVTTVTTTGEDPETPAEEETIADLLNGDEQ